MDWLICRVWEWILVPQINEEVVNCMLTTPNTHIYFYFYTPISKNLMLKLNFRTHEQTHEALDAILEKKLISMGHLGLGTNWQMDDSCDWNWPFWIESDVRNWQKVVALGIWRRCTSALEPKSISIESWIMTDRATWGDRRRGTLFESAGCGLPWSICGCDHAPKKCHEPKLGDIIESNGCHMIPI